MTSELLILGYVQQVATELLPGDPGAIARVSDLAVTSFAGGASVSEACRDASSALRSMANHPSRRVAPGSLPVSFRPNEVCRVLTSAALN